MTAPLLEQFANAAVTDLDGSISDSDTSLDVTDASLFPTIGRFRILIGSEIIIVNTVSSNTFSNLERGAEDSVAASHTDEDPVTHIITKGSLDRWIGDNIPNAGYSLPYNTIVDDDGESILDSSDFSWINQGASTVADQAGSMLMTLPTSAGVNLRGLARTAPSTPYAYIGALQACIPRAGSDDVAMAMFGFRNSTEFEMQTFILGCNGDESFRFGVQNYSTGTSSGTQVRSLIGFCLWAPAVWVRIEDNGTNLIYSLGMDGSNWIQVFSAGRTSFIPTGPDQIFWGGVNNSNTGNTGLVRLLHWSREY